MHSIYQLTPESPFTAVEVVHVPQSYRQLKLHLGPINMPRDYYMCLITPLVSSNFSVLQLIAHKIRNTNGYLYIYMYRLNNHSYEQEK